MNDRSLIRRRLTRTFLGCLRSAECPSFTRSRPIAISHFRDYDPRACRQKLLSVFAILAERTRQELIAEQPHPLALRRKRRHSPIHTLNQAFQKSLNPVRGPTQCRGPCGPELGCRIRDPVGRRQTTFVGNERFAFICSSAWNDRVLCCFS
jgi:hypothetical protein